MRANFKNRKQLLKEISDLRHENESLRAKVDQKAGSSKGFTGSADIDAQSIEVSLLRTLVDLLPAPVYVKDRDSRFILANESCARYMGASSPQELIGKTDADYYPPEIAAGFRSEEIEVLNGNPKINKEENGCMPSGMDIVFIVSKVPLKDNTGKIIGLVGTSLDISEIKKIEEARIKSESNLQALINNTNESIWSLDNNYNLIICNDNFRNAYLAAYGVELKIGIPLVSILTPELRAFWKPKYDTVLAGEKLSFEFSETIQGTFYSFNVSLNPIFLDGKVTGISALSVDITHRKLAEAKLRNSEERLKLLFDYAPDAYYLHDLKGTFIDGNIAAEILFGYKRDELIGKNLFQIDLLSSNQIPKASGILQKSALGQSTGPDEFELTKKDGSKVTVEIISHPIVIDGKSVIVGLARDISDRISAENALREREEWFRNLFEQASDGILYLTLEGEIVEVNRAFAEMHGYTVNEFAKRNISELDSDDKDKQLFHERMNSIKKGEKLKFEVEHFHKYGHKIYLEVTTGLITMANKIYIMASHRDITENRLAQESLRISEENFRILFDENPLPTILSEIPSGKISFVNKRMAAIMQMKPEDILHKTPNELGLLNDPGDMERLTRMITSQGFVDNVEVDKNLPNNQTGTDLIFMRLLTINGERYCLTVIQDITERKHAEMAIVKAREKAEESDRLKSAFLANMGHEIRTPMNGILGFSELLKNKRLTQEEQLGYVDIIEKSGIRMLNIINDLIDISKIESGQMNINVSTCNLKEQAEFLYTFFKPEVESKGLDFSYTCALLPNNSIIITDKDKVTAILINLIKNAVKFTDKGSIEFGYTKNGNFLEFFVKDTGVGVKPEQKQVIFERFRQGSESLSRNYEGAGLGLSISKSFAEMLGGNIWMESKPEKGSTFYFTIRYKTENSTETANDSKHKTESANKLKKLKLLIAEDDNISALLLSNIIKEFSCEVLWARTGTEAVEKSTSICDIDLILMDIKIPEIDGYEATRQIRNINKKVVIIAQTAYAQTGDKEKAIKAGCNDYISKPIMKHELLSLIRKHCKM